MDFNSISNPAIAMEWTNAYGVVYDGQTLVPAQALGSTMLVTLYTCEPHVTTRCRRTPRWKPEEAVLDISSACAPEIPRSASTLAVYLGRDESVGYPKFLMPGGLCRRALRY